MSKGLSGASACLMLSASLFLSACQSTVEQPEGVTPQYEATQAKGLVSGVGIESQDIISMTDQMYKDILEQTTLANRPVSPRVIVDDAYFVNESAQRLNKRQIVDRLRVGLQRAAKGNIAFVNRERAEMVQKERELKRAGQVDLATEQLAQAQAGADYRLNGRISSLDARDSTGQVERYNQILFEITDLETGIIIWSNIYEFSKSAQDDVIYR